MNVLYWILLHIEVSSLLWILHVSWRWENNSSFWSEGALECWPSLEPLLHVKKSSCERTVKCKFVVFQSFRIQTDSCCIDISNICIEYYRGHILHLHEVRLCGRPMQISFWSFFEVLLSHGKEMKLYIALELGFQFLVVDYCCMK